MNAGSILSTQTNQYTYRQNYTYSKIANNGNNQINSNINTCDMLPFCISDRMLVNKNNISLKGGLNLKACTKMLEKYSEKNPQVIIELSDKVKFAEVLCSHKLSKHKIELILNSTELNCSERMGLAGEKFTGTCKIEMDDLKSALKLFRDSGLYKCVDRITDVDDYKTILATYLKKNPQVALEEPLLDEFAQIAQMHGLSKKDVLFVMNCMKPRTKGETCNIQQEYLHNVLRTTITSKRPELFEKYNSQRSLKDYKAIMNNYLKENPNARIDKRDLGVFIDALYTHNISGRDVHIIFDMVETLKTQGLGYQKVTKVEQDDFFSFLDAVIRIQKGTINAFDKNL